MPKMAMVSRERKLALSVRAKVFQKPAADGVPCGGTCASAALKPAAMASAFFH